MYSIYGAAPARRRPVEIGRRGMKKLRKGVARAMAVVFGLTPTVVLAQSAATAGRPNFNIPDLAITKGQPIAFSLCDNAPVPAGGQLGATGGLSCNNPAGGVRGGCPPYKFRLADSRDALRGGTFNTFLPVGLHLEPSGLIHGTVKSLGVLTKAGGVICVEDACNSKPTCKQLELQPQNPNTNTLSSDTAILRQSADVSPGGPPQEPRAQGNPSAAAPAPAGGQGGTAATGGTAAGGGGMSGGTVAALVGGPLIAGGAVLAATALANSASNCPSASGLVNASQGTMVLAGADTACTSPFIHCGQETNLAFRVCVDISCTSGFYYYQTSDGARFNCGAVDISGDFVFDSSFCNGAAGRVIAYCQAH
jgi:hypothetical protein